MSSYSTLEKIISQTARENKIRTPNKQETERPNDNEDNSIKKQKTKIIQLIVLTENFIKISLTLITLTTYKWTNQCPVTPTINKQRQWNRE